MSVYITLCCGILIISWGSILVRWMGDIHPLIITFYRLAFSALLLAIYMRLSGNSPCWNMWFRRGRHACRAKRGQSIRAPTETSGSPSHQDLVTIKRQIAGPSARIHREWLYLGLAGLFLSMHFITWITSLQWTTVSNSIFLESTHPFFGWILSLVFLRERISFLFIPTFLVASIGMYYIIAGDFHIESDALYGDLLAVFSALCIAAYLIIARRLKNTMDILFYLWVVYSIAAAITFSIILIKGLNFWNLPASGWFLLLLMASGPNLIGHSILNWASRMVPVYIVNMALLGEAVLATIYAALLLHELPTKEFYLGAPLIIASMVVLFIRSDTKQCVTVSKISKY